MRITAHAKINWVLDITGKRPDGYHLMDMLMQPISLSDTVSLSEADSISLSIINNLPGADENDIPQDNGNLVWKAVTLMQGYAGANRGARVVLEKNIPVKAGLGGGSVDAAATLVGLNRLWNLNLSDEILDAIALKLGADVPFFMHGRLCRVQGIGDEVRMVSRGPKWHCVIVQPCSGLSTREMFDSYDEQHAGEQGGIILHPDIDALEQILMREDLAQLPIHPGNVLEFVSCAAQPEIGQAAGFLVRNGAVCAQMSGSGSAVFGIFQNAKEAESCAEAARERWNRVYVCQTCDEALQVHG